MQDQILTEVNFRPGIITELSPNASEPFWVAANRVRFRLGKPESIGGWVNTSIPTYTKKLWGRPSYMLDVRNLTGQRKLLIGTHVGLFGSNYGQFFDVTPVVETTAVTNILNTSAGSSLVRVSAATSLLTIGTIVAFTSANTSIGGTITLCPNATTTAHYQVVETTTSWFVIDAGTTAISTQTFAGGSFTMRYKYMAGVSSNPILGWSGGVWSGDFPWSGSQLALNRNRARIWSMDTWGTDALAVCGSPLFLWDVQLSVFDQNAVIVTAAPSIIDIIRVATNIRQVCAYGTHTISGEYDPLLIRWANQESLTDWTPTDTNRAGDFRLNSDGTTIKCVEKVGDQFLILTDRDAFLQQFVGGNDVFGFPKVGTNCGGVSKNCMAVLGDVAYWMSQGRFFRYAGRVEPLECTVLRYIFDNIDTNQYDKVFAGTISRFNEIIWFYPVKGPFGLQPENTRYVIYNTVENHWTVGEMSRTTWNDNTVFNRILATGPTGTGVYEHETGYTDDGFPLNSWIESSPVDLVDGDQIIFSNKIVPDFTSHDGSALVEPITLDIIYRKYPGETHIEKGPFIVSASTRRIYFRLRGREFRVRVSSPSLQPWRMGKFRMALQPDGKR